jgi:hypothetical protein
MAASTHAVAGAKSKFQPVGPSAGGNLICVTKHYSLTANASANDVFQMIKIPNGARVVDGYIALDSVGAFTYTVGDGGDPDRFIAASSVSGSATDASFSKEVLPYQYSLSANASPQYDTVDVKLTAVTATVALSFDLTVFYLVDGQEIS